MSDVEIQNLVDVAKIAEEIARELEDAVLGKPTSDDPINASTLACHCHVLAQDLPALASRLKAAEDTLTVIHLGAGDAAEKTEIAGRYFFAKYGDSND